MDPEDEDDGVLDGPAGLSDPVGSGEGDGAIDQDDAGDEPAEGLVLGPEDETQAGEEPGADAKADEPDETEDAPTGAEVADEPDEATSEGAKGSQKTKPEVDDATALRARVRELEQGLGNLLGVLTQQQQAPPPAAPPQLSPAELELRDAVGVIFDGSLTPQERQEQLAKFSPAVRASALEQARAAERRMARQATDPQGWFRELAEPLLKELVEPLLQPVRQAEERIALREFTARHPDVFRDRKSAEQVADLVVNKRVPAEFAVQYVRQQRQLDQANRKKAAVEAKERQQRATQDSRRDQGARRPEHRAHKRPRWTGREQSFEDCLQAEANAEE